jgi:poly-gamma-glutamate capsule biosynthesis protein CapA/YwtB (metallophosphatase superfamily)
VKNFKIIVLFLFIFTLLGCSNNQRNLVQSETINKQQTTEINNGEVNNTLEKLSPIVDNNKPPEKVVTKTSATLEAVGDVLLHNNVYNKAKNNNTYDFKPMFEEVKPYLSNADITIANSESIVGGEDIGVSTYPSFNSPYEIADALKDAGVDIVSMANNHTLDRGADAIHNAHSYWDNLGILYTGSYDSQEDKDKIRIIEKNNIKFSFLSYTYGTNGIPVPKGKEYFVNLINEEEIKKDIQEAKKISDVVVVSLHFGNEYERMPNDFQKKIAQLCADEGANIIIGHHPHVLQPVEWIDGANGNKAIVIYSLGNFISAQYGDYKDIGGIFKITVEKEEKDNQKTINIVKPEFMPTFVTRPNYIVKPMFKMTNKELANVEKKYEEIRNHMSQDVHTLEFME